VDRLARRVTTPAARLAAVLLSFAALLGCAVALGDLLGLAERPGGATSFDASITSWIVAHRTSGLTTVARAFSTLGSQKVLAPLTAIAVLVALVRRSFVPAGLLVVAWGGAILLYSLTKQFVGRHRPPTHLWLSGATGTSFPSGHAVQSLATYVVLAWLAAVSLRSSRARAVAAAVVLAAGIGWSRVYLGVHWSSDVAAGWLIAAAWVTILIELVPKPVP
jgi:membrane-associated phospholipid phosphatase